jgi:K+-transporting ATPase ATPase A chain
MITQWMTTLGIPIAGGLLLAAPLAAHLGRVWTGEKTILDDLLGPLERGLPRLLGIDTLRGQAWDSYALRLVAFNAAAFAGLYLALRLYTASPEAAFHAAMTGLTGTGLGPGDDARGFGLPATGLALAVRVFVAGGSTLAVTLALARAVAGRGGVTIGNVWSDLIRNGLLVLLPGSALLFAALAAVTAVAPSERPIVLDMALDGGRFACAVAFGRVTRAALEGRALMWVMALVALPLAWLAAAAQEPAQPGGAGLFAALVTATARGGGGPGVAGLLIIALLAVCVEGLLVGRSPEYIGKRLGARAVKLAILASLALWGAIMAYSALATLAPAVIATWIGPAMWMRGTGYEDTVIAIAQALGRFGAMIPILALAGSVAATPRRAPTAGVPAAHDAPFVGLLTMMVLIFAALRTLPALAFAGAGTGG